MSNDSVVADTPVTSGISGMSGMSADVFLVAFATVTGIGTVRTKLLIDYFGSAKNAWEAPENELEKTGLAKNALSELLSQREKLNPEKYVKSLSDRGIKILTINSPQYPSRLKEISDPPFVLFLKTSLSLEQFNQLCQRKIIGVVGTRKMTTYGGEVTKTLVSGLVENGYTIVSGMALGVDGVAHGTALESGGKTIAVLGAGVEVIYPPSHRNLYYRILDQGGVILSEVAPEKLVNKGIFPARNRIISGLSRAILVTEGAVDSGSLITARLAIEQGRDVFAVPGPINSAMAQGTNYLLKNGAKLVTDVEDILEETNEIKTINTINSINLTSQVCGPRSAAGLKIKPMKSIIGESPEEQKVLDLLFIEPREFDQLVRETKIPIAILGSLLGKMEIEGKIKLVGGMYRGNF